ncbi:MAG: hypothetical protein COA53_00730 [Rhodobacteraceae bacterium]|nr:MAG: hypothetical protein COA53_00730 [Paracoccaceae bacterium]
MTIFDGVLILIALVLAGWALTPKARNNAWWQATVTPLASIIGSGFLVVAPLLAAVAGSLAVVAMLIIVALAFAIGHVIRFNIRHAESLEGTPNGSRNLLLATRISNVSLSVAYVISVAFYIRLLASFALSMTPFANDTIEAALATAILAAIGLIGWAKGLKGLEMVETVSVSIKLSIIVALLVALFVYNFDHGVWSANLPKSDADMLTRLRMLGGMLLVVQGFETSRYLGRSYSADMRARTMLWAQVSSAVIYVLFVALVVPVLIYLPSGAADDTAIIEVSGYVAWILPFMLIFAALMSQLSAGIADTVGAGGLVAEETGNRVPERLAYPALIAFSIALIWLFDIFEVIAIASRTFAFYYMMQTVIGIIVTRKLLTGRKRAAQLIWFSLLAGILALIVIFAIPAE